MILALTMNIIFFISLLGIVCGTGNKDQPNASKVISLRNKDAEGTTCDWDRKWPYETRPCSGWSNNGFKLTKDSKQPNRGRYVIYENGLHKIGNSANLKSPWYRDSSGHCKLKFHVRMRHINLGRMHVWLTTLNGSRTRIWHEYADLGERWHIQKISLGSINGPFRLQFLVERGVSDRASVSLDDISLTNCTTHQHDDPDTHGCSLSEFMCNTGICIPLHQICDGMNDCLYSEDETQNCEGWKVCDFEKDTCSYTNGTSDIYWTKHSGNTPTNHTGPNSDHTLRNRRGHYLYFETTLGKLGYRGTVLSEVYQRPPSCHNNKTSPFYNSCWVRFYYHMYGAHVHTLQLHILEIDFHLPNKTISKGRYFRKVWSRVMDTKTEAEGNGLNSWIRVALPLPDVNRRFILKFEAIRGFRYLGDIAIDDISLAAECYGQG